jgi:F1F0 ATPase subunit 2
MNSALPLEPVVLLLVPLLAGFGVGLVYFAALLRTVKRFIARDGWLEPVAVTVGRLGVAVAMFALAAHTSAVVLLVTFVGFLLARTVALDRSKRAG